MASLLLSLLVASATGASTGNPLGKVLQLMTSLIEKIVDDGAAEDEEFHTYFEWCDDVTRNSDQEIQTASADKSRLESSITKLGSDIEVATAKVDELAGLIAKSESELKGAKGIRGKEKAEFQAGEKELMEAVDALDRATKVLAKGGSFAQLDSSAMAGTLQALSVIIDGASFSAADKQKLAAFVQAQDQAEDADEDVQQGAPAAAAYESKSGGIVDVLEDMKEKAETQLASLRKAEVDSKHNYKMLQQGLDDQTGADTKDMETTKARKSSAQEQKAGAGGELEITTKELANSQKELAIAQSTCMQVAADHESTVVSRKDELKVLGEAKKELQAQAGGAAASFVQVAASSTSRSPAVVGVVRKLARKHHSAALAQLASRIASVVRFGGDDPFDKVKGMIQDMIVKLEGEAESMATEKAYCDEQISRTDEKKGDLEDDIAGMTAEVDKAASASAKLKRETQTIQSELGDVSKKQAEMDQIRQVSHKDFEQTKADLESGLTSVRSALGMLRDYYAAGDDAAFIQDGDDSKFNAFMQQPAMPVKHEKAAGAGAGIIGMLEVVESDMATNLAKEETEEGDAQSDYDKLTEENKISTASKEQDVKYKTQSAKSLDTTISEISSDRSTSGTELSAVDEFDAKLKDRCVAKPETYEERSKRRADEINGLKEALNVLESEASLVQGHSHRHHRRHARGKSLIAQ